MTYQMVATTVTLNDLEGNLPLADVFKCNLLNICAAFYTISTDVARRAVSLQQQSFLFLYSITRNNPKNVGLNVSTYRTSYANAAYAGIVCMSVCLSVCPSVTSRSCTKMAKLRITHTTPYDSVGTLVYQRQNIGDIPTRSPPTGAPNRGGVGSNRRSSTNILLYLRNGARQGYTCYRRLIETRMRSIEWCYLQ